MKERRAPVNKLQTILIAGFSIILAINIVLSWASHFLVLYCANFPEIKVEWILYAIVTGLWINANLWKFPSGLFKKIIGSGEEANNKEEKGD